MLESIGHKALSDGEVSKDFGLIPVMEFATARRIYTADEKFTVVLDSSDFGHVVGEVEVLSDTEESTASQELDDFLKKYEWFFQRDEKVKGKLTAYLEMFPHPFSIVK